LSDEQTEAAILHGDDYAGSLEESSAKLQSVVKGVSFRITVPSHHYSLSWRMR